MPDGPTLAARRLAAQRLALERTRPSARDGDAEGERRLYRSVAGPVRALGTSEAVAVRTRVVDGEIARALGHGLEQIVLVGAGYDGRALRFARDATQPLRWFELNAPSTLSDKAERLVALGIRPPPAVVPVPFDLGTDVGAVLRKSGHDGLSASLFVCEDALSALSLEGAAHLCAGLRSRAADGSGLVAGFVVAPPAGSGVRALRAGTDLVRTGATGARQHRLQPGDAEKLLAVTGWHVLSSARSVPSPGSAAHTLVVVAEPARTDPART